MRCCWLGTTTDLSLPEGTFPAWPHSPSLAPSSFSQVRGKVTQDSCLHRERFTRLHGQHSTQQVKLAHCGEVSRSPPETIPPSPSPVCRTWAAGQRKKSLYADTAPHGFMRWAATSSSGSKTTLVNHSEVSVKTKSRQMPWVLER